jgi:adenine-specific DNA-methyltransferase
MTLLKSSIQRKKELGIFYTPPQVTAILCDWAIRNSADKIFEPSFGGCGFLESSCERLKELENSTPIKQIYGCDIDDTAFNDYLYPKFKSQDNFIDDRFLKENFLSLTVNNFTEDGFNTVVGNPPYVSYHKMDDSQRLSVSEIVKKLHITLDKRASLWAYFVIHSLQFLKEEGRIAFVLPGSFLHSNYAKIIRDQITTNFSRSIVIQIGERLFSSEGTEENTSILLAEGFGVSSSEGRMEVDFVSKLSDLKTKVNEWGKKKNTQKFFNSRASYELISETLANNLASIESKLPVIKIGDVANVVIGIVTGANNFFILDKDDVAKNEIPSEFQQPIFSKFRMTDGIKFTLEDWENKQKENFRCVFINTGGKKRVKDELLRRYLKKFPLNKRKENVTFSKRPIWHSPLYMEIPDAFFPYMHNSGPRIILNDAETLCTNTIHRVFFKKDGEREINETQKKFLAISILSSFSQISAELEGRIYGSGALKLEPSEVKRIKIVFPESLNERVIDEKFNEIDKLLRENQNKQIASQTNEIVRNEVDKFIISLLEDEELPKLFKAISDELSALRERRKGWL